MQVPPFSLSEQLQQLGDALDHAVLEVLRSGQYIGGATIGGFEAAFADSCGVPYAIGGNRGTDALVLALGGLGAFGLWLDHPGWLAWVGVAPEVVAAAPRAVGDVASLIAFFLALPVATVPLQPLVSSFSRRYEFEADAWAARETGGQVLSEGLIALSRDNGQPLTTDPWFSAFHDSHPPVPLRVAALAEAPAVQGTA
jgi:hypothetical protein